MEITPATSRQIYWNARGRWLVFVLAASSIACLLADFYRLCPMRIFTRFVLVTIAAHAVFGVGLGFAVGWLSRRPVMISSATSGAPAQAELDRAPARLGVQDHGYKLAYMKRNSDLKVA